MDAQYRFIIDGKAQEGCPARDSFEEAAADGVAAGRLVRHYDMATQQTRYLFVLENGDTRELNDKSGVVPV